MKRKCLLVLDQVPASELMLAFQRVGLSDAVVGERSVDGNRANAQRLAPVFLLRHAELNRMLVLLVGELLFERLYQVLQARFLFGDPLQPLLDPRDRRLAPAILSSRRRDGTMGRRAVF